MKMQRSAGILLPISSLPSPYGIGCFSQEAYDFVDWLKEAGQTYWQILPLGVTSYGDSPYQSFSAFTGTALEHQIWSMRFLASASGASRQPSMACTTV